LYALPVNREKDLPVSLEKFSDDEELARIDEILEKIIRQRAYKNDLQEKINQAKLDLESLEAINNSFQDHTLITENAFTSFELASTMYNNISTTATQAEEQGLGLYIILTLTPPTSD
jgi:hypothetical protein